MGLIELIYVFGKYWIKPNISSSFNDNTCLLSFKISTLARKNIRPFADFSYKMVIFKRLEKYLKLTQKSSFLHHLLMLMGDASQ